jgi:hypothetical protein
MSTIAGQYFYTTRVCLADYFFSEGFCGWVERKVGSDKYLIHTLKKKSHQLIVVSDFFMESQAQFFDEFEDMQEARKSFLKELAK